MPVFVRLGAHDEMPAAWSWKRRAGRLAGWWNTARRLSMFPVVCRVLADRKGPGLLRPYAAVLKAWVTVPVIVTGGIREPGFADRIVLEGKADWWESGGPCWRMRTGRPKPSALYHEVECPQDLKSVEPFATSLGAGFFREQHQGHPFHLE